MYYLLVAVSSTLLCFGSQTLFAQNQEVGSFPEVVRVEEKASPSEDETNVLTEVIGQYPYDDSYYLQRIHNDGYYHLVGWLGANGATAVLHDGSEWAIEYYGRQKVLNWVQTDDIFIKPSLAWFSSNKYVLNNRTQNHTVEATLTYTFQIANIEPYQRLVLLSDNTVWQVGPDVNFSQWQVGQRVLVGVNNKWRTAPLPHVLINVDMRGQPYCQAIFYGYPAQ